jgi:hypothetical protein
VDELNDLQELMWDARERWITVRTTLRERLGAARSGEAFDHFEAQESPGSFVRLGTESEPPPFLTKELRGWARKPYSWRVETERWDGASYAEVGDRAWRPDLTYHGCGPGETESPDPQPLDKPVTGVFDPRIALTELEVVKLVGETEHAARKTVRLAACLAKRQGDPTQVRSLQQFWGGDGPPTTSSCSPTQSAGCRCGRLPCWTARSSLGWRWLRWRSKRMSPKTYCTPKSRNGLVPLRKAQMRPCPVPRDRGVRRSGMSSGRAEDAGRV